MAAVNVVGIFVAAACWALINVVAGTSNLGMAVLLFIVVYAFSYIRSLSDRFFGIGVLGPLFSYTACMSVVGVAGANTTNGQTFDSNYLLHTLYAFLIGSAISFAVNVLIFPELAEPELRRVLRDTAACAADLLRLTVLSDADFADSSSANTSSSSSSSADARASITASLQVKLALASRLAAEARAELAWSRFSARELGRAAGCLAAMAAQLHALDTAMLRRTGAPAVLLRRLTAGDSDGGKKVEATLAAAVDGCNGLLAEAGEAVRPGGHAPGPAVAAAKDDAEAGAIEASAELFAKVRGAIATIEELQFQAVYRVLNDDEASEADATMEDVAEANFFVVAMRE
ncbi:hypothetical protein HK405_012215, partial [Cladochytrium tenue]